ncbi:MAG: aldehyde dehydrogenase family protein [Pseudomonadota bacterium]
MSKIFGPIAPIMQLNDEQSVIEMANSTVFELAASTTMIWPVFGVFPRCWSLEWLA